MKPLRINIVLPFPTTKPNGGVKIMYEYANRLQEKGHRVTVLHSIRRPFKKMKSPLWWKQLVYALKKAKRPQWFPLHPQVDSLIVPSITDKFVPDADIVLSTWWEMVYMTSKLAPSKGKAFNLIQGNEIWTGHEEAVYASYRLPVQHLVIARFLSELFFAKTGKYPLHIPLAIDTPRFSLKQPIEHRDPFSVLMLFSTEAVKGTATGLQALELLKKEFPNLKATMFGVYQQPDLPNWINYHQRPKDLEALYNDHAIFFSPSNSEGWALPPAEAMACGCAVVCTDIGGHADYALDHQTALLTKTGDAADMTNKLKQLLTNNELRISIAKAGNEYLTSGFNWETSVSQMENAFYKAVK